MPRPRVPYSARTVVRAVSALVLVLSLVVATVLAVTVSQFVSAQHDIERKLDPARVELTTLLALYVDQETAERGYILTGREQFLEPYDAAAPRIDEILAHLRGQVSQAVQGRLDDLAAAHRAWLTDAAQPELAAVRRGDRDRAEQLVGSGSGRRLFDEVRAEHRAATSAITAEQEAATERADMLLRRIAVLLALTILAFLATTLLAATAFSRTVLRPLAGLGRASRTVAGGDLSHAVRASGPREVTEVAEDVDTMRRHLLDELDATRRASEALVLGQPVVRALQAALSQVSPAGDHLIVASQVESAEGVLAGDFVDVVGLDDGQVAVVLGDVSGHGPGAAVVGLRLKTRLSALLRSAPVGAALEGLREGLAEEPELFATVFVAVLDPGSGRLEYANAGHPAPVLVSGGRTEELEPTGPLVSAVLDDATWRTATRAFGPGDTLVVFSDGLLEARDAMRGEFGRHGVAAVLAATAGRTPEDIVTRLRTAARDHATAQRDDVTVLVVRRA